MSLESQAMLEIARFFASQPTPEQIMEFHASTDVNDRLAMLIASEKAGTINPDERRELDSYEAIEHIIIHTKAEARRKMRQQAS
jgi:hypothetical protein